MLTKIRDLSSGTALARGAGQGDLRSLPNLMTLTGFAFFDLRANEDSPKNIARLLTYAENEPKLQSGQTNSWSIDRKGPGNAHSNFTGPEKQIRQLEKNTSQKSWSDLRTRGYHTASRRRTIPAWVSHTCWLWRIFNSSVLRYAMPSSPPSTVGGPKPRPAPSPRLAPPNPRPANPGASSSFSSSASSASSISSS